MILYSTGPDKMSKNIFTHVAKGDPLENFDDSLVFYMQFNDLIPRYYQLLIQVNLLPLGIQHLLLGSPEQRPTLKPPP